MKVIQIPFTYYPDPVGGTEIYVEGLSKHLVTKGVEVVVAAPGNLNEEYEHNGLKVYRFAVAGDSLKLKARYGEGDHDAAMEFDKILEKEQPDIVHIHAFSSAVSSQLMRKVKDRKIPVLFTYHTPTVSCQRGTLLKWGKEVCNGKIVVSNCSACTLHGLGLNQLTSRLLGSIPTYVGKALENINLKGGMWTALRTADLIETKQAAFQFMMSESEHIVAVCDWVRELLLINGVPENKITVIRQPIGHLGEDNQIKQERKQNEILKIAFLGRLDPAKGVDVLIKSIQCDKRLPVALDIYGVSPKDNNSSYVLELEQRAKNDHRIKFKQPVPNDKIVDLLRQYDVLAVPSQGLETGPLVVLEAFAAGIPVIGSNLGGIAELVKHEINGILVESGSIKAWYHNIKKLYGDHTILQNVTRGIDSHASVNEVGNKVLKLYRRCIVEKQEY